MASTKEDRVLVAAASDLRSTLPDIVDWLKPQYPWRIEVSYGASGRLAQQIAQGAPFEVFLSADEQSVAQLHDRGLTKGRGSIYAQGRLALVRPGLWPGDLAAWLSTWQAEVARRPVASVNSRMAMAHPVHAPYGRAARAVLDGLSGSAAFKPHLVTGENAAQALQFALSGQCWGGLVPLSLVLEAGQLQRLSWHLIPPAWHAVEPLRQTKVLLNGAGAAALQLFNSLEHPDVLAILQQHGLGATVPTKR